MMLASFQYSTEKSPAVAMASDNVMGWLWADPIGWVSLNDQNPGSCSPGPCGSYGANVDPTTRNMNGFAWNDAAGWICFGDSCSACGGIGAPGSAAANLNPVPPPPGTADVHGWAKICNEGAAGYVSLNCADPGACAPYAYKVTYNPATKFFTAAAPPPFTSLAWNGNSDGSGFGYFDFSKAQLNTPAENDPSYGPVSCKNANDDDLSGTVDCQDSACQPTATCQEIPGNTDAGGNPVCKNGVDDDGNGQIDCAVAACKPSAECAETPVNTDFGGTPLCGNGTDDDGDGSSDCADPGCAGYAGPPGASCALPPPPPGSEPSCTDPNPPFNPLGPAACCHDTLDNDSNGIKDCDDATCQASEPTCVPAWLQTKFGNIYAQQGLSASSSPLIVGKSATYCLTTQGTITGFSSEKGCTETGAAAQPIKLPTGAEAYQGTLGSLDINGILLGRYGAVATYTGTLPPLLAGKVYRIVGNAVLPATVFANGASQTERGNGLLFVEGGNLTITGNISYPALGSLQYLRNLASFGIIVTKKLGVGGNIIIQPGVTVVSAAMFAEESISTGTQCPGSSSCPAEQPLDVYGLMAAKQINLQRSYRDPVRSAELVTFDGRAVANPPPGMADISKSLPVIQEGF